MVETTALTKLIETYGLGVALVIVVVGLLVWTIKTGREDRKDKDREIKELRNIVIQLQEKSIVNDEKLANNIAANTEISKQVKTQLEITGRMTETLISSVNAVL